jgi:hypothetical protein
MQLMSVTIAAKLEVPSFRSPMVTGKRICISAAVKPGLRLETTTSLSRLISDLAR